MTLTAPTIRFDDATLGLVIDDLPQLTGSPKQVAWAEGIRAGLFDGQIRQRFDSARRAATEAGKLHQMAPAIAKMSALLAPVLAETSAKWWIDNRNCDLQHVAAKRAA